MVTEENKTNGIAVDELYLGLVPVVPTIPKKFPTFLLIESRHDCSSGDIRRMA